MSTMALCSSQVAASPACGATHGSSRLGICTHSCASVGATPAPRSRSSECYGRATLSPHRRLVVTHAQRRRKKRSATLVDSTPASVTSGTPGRPKWDEFAAQVSGEWDGYSVEFNMFIEPLELPESVIPGAFREWGRQVHDWQLQCSSLAHPDVGHLWYKVTRLYPTVGCEGNDATVYSVETCDAPQTASALAYHPTGSYTSVWRGNRVTKETSGSGLSKEVTREGTEVEVEQCLQHDKTRLRVFQKLGYRRHILVLREAWEGPFRNGASLGVSTSATATFATEPKLTAKATLGKWNSNIYTLKNFQPQEGYTSSELIHSGNEVVERTVTNTFLYSWLPKDAWTLLLKTESGATTIETGWLAEPDKMIVTKCEIESSGELKEVSLRVETRISSKVAPLNVSAQELEELLSE